MSDPKTDRYKRKNDLKLFQIYSSSEVHWIVKYKNSCYVFARKIFLLKLNLSVYLK